VGDAVEDRFFVVQKASTVIEATGGMRSEIVLGGEVFRASVEKHVFPSRKSRAFDGHEIVRTASMRLVTRERDSIGRKDQIDFTPLQKKRLMRPGGGSSAKRRTALGR
jgi:hypothetical protein